MANCSVEHACADGGSVSIKASESSLGFAYIINAAHSACDQGPFFSSSKWPLKMGARYIFCDSRAIFQNGGQIFKIKIR